MSEIDDFFKGLPSEDKQAADVFNDKKPTVVPEKENKEIENKEEVEEGRKNRRHRRLEEQLQRERDSNIALNERIRTLSEVQQFERDTKQESDLDPDLVRVFGNTDAGKEIARIMDKKLTERVTEAEERALQRFDEQQVAIQQEQKKYESVIDSELEALEDEHNVDLTSNSPQARKARREFLEMVEKLSPKDENGTITGYADFGSTFEFYKNSQEKQDASRNKEIASRSLQRSNGTTTEKPIEGRMTFDRAKNEIRKQFNK